MNIGELNTVEELVREILDRDPQARNDDKYLTFRVIEKSLGKPQGNSILLTLDLLSKLPSFEAIRRTRAKIQNVDGDFLPDDPRVRDRRKIAEETYRTWSRTQIHSPRSGAGTLFAL